MVIYPAQTELAHQAFAVGEQEEAQARRVVEAAGTTPVTIAGGVTTAEEVAALDRLGADAQVGMALYTGRMALADGPMKVRPHSATISAKCAFSARNP